MCDEDIPQTELDLIADSYGWDSDFNFSATVDEGDAVPQWENNTDSLFVTSDKMRNPGAAEPRIWPMFPTAASLVTGSGGCVWETTDIQSVWRELHIWDAADRLLIDKVMPSFVTRWNNLTTVQQD